MRVRSPDWPAIRESYIDLDAIHAYSFEDKGNLVLRIFDDYYFLDQESTYRVCEALKISKS